MSKRLFKQFIIYFITNRFKISENEIALAIKIREIRANSWLKK